MKTQIEYTDDGRVIIPIEMWEEIKEIAEHLEIYEIVEKRKESKSVYTLDELLKQKQLSRENLQD